MVFVYLLLIMVLMGVGGMLIDQNPGPYVVAVQWFGRGSRIECSIFELIGWSMVGGAAVMCLPYVRALWDHGRERRRLAQDAEALRQDNTALRRDTETARAEARLLEARVAEGEERYAQLEAEARPLLTMRREAPPPPPPVPSRWRRR